MKFTKYEKLGAYHWTLYEAHTQYRTHVDRVVSWLSEDNILDVGAGDGVITYLLKAKGVDDEPSAVELAKEKGADVVLADAYSLPFPDSSFDSILMCDVLEHFEYPEKALREAYRVAKSYLYVVTPVQYVKGKISDEFHYQEWSPEELNMLVEPVGFTLIENIVVSEVNTQYAKFKKNALNNNPL